MRSHLNATTAKQSVNCGNVLNVWSFASRISNVGKLKLNRWHRVMTNTLLIFINWTLPSFCNGRTVMRVRTRLNILAVPAARGRSSCRSSSIYRSISPSNIPGFVSDEIVWLKLIENFIFYIYSLIFFVPNKCVILCICDYTYWTGLSQYCTKYLNDEFIYLFLDLFLSLLSHCVWNTGCTLFWLYKAIFWQTGAIV